MRKSSLVALLVAMPCAAPFTARAQATQTSTAAAKLRFDPRMIIQLKEEIREELREDLREELKSEIKAELAAEGAAAGPVEPDAWAEEEWKWEEPVKPELNFLEFDGYFRFRYDFFSNLDLGLYYRNSLTGEATGPFASGYSPPVPLCNTDVTRPLNNDDGTVTPAGASCANGAGESNALGGANMRLRLEPVFNVYEDIKIKMQVDILDNLILGSTPETFPNNPFAPLSAFSSTQIPPVHGTNSLWTDSVRVKRVWAEVMTPLGQLRMGRMPSQFGLGVLANEGRGLDSDYGDTSDRLMFATKIGDYYIVPAFDWAVSGPTSATELNPYGQPFDRDQRDDVDQYILAIVKRDSEEEIRQKLENDETVLNYGTYQVGRFQALDAASYFRSGDPFAQAETDELVERDAQAYIYSYWFKLMWRKLTVEAEYAGIIGRIGNSVVSGPYGASDESISIFQHGAAVTVEYKLLRDALTLRLLLVAASGDSAAGWGVRPLGDVSQNASKWDGSQAVGADRSISNFRFDPDFIVDMIFWRELVGMVTDAMVVRPGVQYNLTEGFGARLDLVYSRAWFAESTPSGAFSSLPNQADGGRLGNPSKNLGIEGDFKLFYDSEDGFHAWFQYGLFVPLGGLDRPVAVEPGSAATRELPTQVVDGVPRVRLNASVAHTMQLLFGITF